MEPKVVEYLQNHSFSQLEKEYNVLSYLSQNRTKVSLDYDQFSARGGISLIGECRGLVLGLSAPSSKDWKAQIPAKLTVLAWPMNRFYNQEEGFAAPINWNDPALRVFEKLDGTMILMYFDSHQNKWCAGTRKVCEGDILIKGYDLTFSQLFFQTLQESWLDSASRDNLFDYFDKGVTYVFELTSPYNRVVVKYETAQVSLIAARQTATGQELNIDSLSQIQIPRPANWPLHSSAQISVFVDSAAPDQLEGAVVCDSNFRRLKIKNKAWVLASKSKDSIQNSMRSVLESLLLGTLDDVLPLLDAKYRSTIENFQEKARTCFANIDAKFQDFRTQAAGDRKKFASLVNNSNDWTPVYFGMWQSSNLNANSWTTQSLKNNRLSNAGLDAIIKMIEK